MLFHKLRFKVKFPRTMWMPNPCSHRIKDEIFAIVTGCPEWADEEGSSDSVDLLTWDSTQEAAVRLIACCCVLEHVTNFLMENNLVISIRIIVKQRKDDIEVEFENLPTHTIKMVMLDKFRTITLYEELDLDSHKIPMNKCRTEISGLEWSISVDTEQKKSLMKLKCYSWEAVWLNIRWNRSQRMHPLCRSGWMWIRQQTGKLFWP